MLYSFKGPLPATHFWLYFMNSLAVLLEEGSKNFMISLVFFFILLTQKVEKFCIVDFSKICKVHKFTKWTCISFCHENQDLYPNKDMFKVAKETNSLKYFIFICNDRCLYLLQRACSCKCMQRQEQGVDSMELSYSQLRAEGHGAGSQIRSSA